MALSLIYKGFNYVDYYNQEYLNNSLPAVAGTGANGVALTPDWGIDVAESSIYAGGETTDTTNLGTAIVEANQNGMTAFVRPLVDFLYNQQSTNGPIYGNPGDYYGPAGTVNPADLPTGQPDANGGTIPTTTNGTVPGGAGLDTYRGFLNPADINVPVFFGSPTTPGSYDYMIVSQAKTAAAAGATLFSVGTELDSLADNPAYTTYWNNLIADVRAAAPSLKLTFSANWASASQVTFWNKLDYVGIDGYVPLSNTVPAGAAQNPSLASLIAGWNTPSNVTIAYSGGTTVSQTLGGVSAIDAFDQLAQASISKQFIFTELGYQNDTGAATDPTGGSYQGVTDPSLQAELYTAFFDAWGAAQQTANAHGGLVDGIPFALVGAYIWDWTPDLINDNWSPGNPSNSAALTAIEAGFATPSPLIVVSAGHTSSGVNVPKGVAVIVLSGGTARSTVILSGGTETVSAGGKDFNAKISGKQFVHGTATSATVAAGGTQYVQAGGTASATIVHSGGSEIITSGGTARGATVTSGGRQIVSSGGVASGATVKHGGTQTVLSGGTARGTVLSGSEVVSAGGRVSGTVVHSGGTEIDHGRASGGTITGGLFEVASGGTASGTVTFVSGGTLQLDAGASFPGAIKGFAKPDRIDLRGIAFSSSGTTRSFVEAASNTSGTLTVTSGTHTVHLTLLGKYTTSNFKLASDGHGGTLVTDPPAAATLAPLTFADMALTQLLSGAANPGNLPNYCRHGTVGLSEPSYAGQTLFATGPPAGPGGGDHQLLLLAPR